MTTTARRLRAMVAGFGAALVIGVALAQVVEVEESPESGTFYSLQRTNDPPLPFCPFPELPLYAVGTNRFVYDDREVDYLAMAQRATALRLLRQAAAGDSSSAMPPSQLQTEGVSLLSLDSEPPAPPGGDEGGGTNETSYCGPPMFLSSTGLCLYPPVLTGGLGTNGTFSELSLTLTNGLAEARYDVFYTTNLTTNVAGLNLTNWAWLGRGGPGQTNFVVTDGPAPEAYFRLGTMADADGDGLTDAFEGLVSHTAAGVWSNPDTDGDEMPDGWEVTQGLNPSVGDGAADADGDGLTNWIEWLAGSDPRVAVAWGVWVSSPAVGSGIP